MHGQQQYVMVTKQRRKSGCFAGLFHLIGGIFTLGLWPLFVWLAHLIGPKKKTAVTTVYGPPQPQIQPYPLQGQPYPPQPPYGYYPPPQLTPEQQQGEQWKQLPGQVQRPTPPPAPYYPPQAYQPPPQAAPPPVSYKAGQPPQVPGTPSPYDPQPRPDSDDPWDTGSIRRR